MNRQEYQEYLDSKDWQRRRKQLIKKKCEWCPQKHELNVHHLSYDNLGQETEYDVITLCKRCHKDLHYYQRGATASNEMVKQQELITQEEFLAQEV